MAATHEHIATATASSSPLFLEVTSIPATYKDLEVIIQSKTDETSYGATSGKVTVNGATTGYSFTTIRKNGSNMYGGIWTSQSNFDMNYAHGPGNQSEMSGYVRLYIPDYATSLWEHPVNWWSTSWDTTTAGEVAYTAGVYISASEEETISSIKWTTVYTIEDDCTMSVYGINYA
tara:strand:+ start:397 stop:921 length:525 start_codon:yes stop_codon:yes gene_type:complete